MKCGKKKVFVVNLSRGKTDVRRRVAAPIPSVSGAVESFCDQPVSLCTIERMFIPMFADGTAVVWRSKSEVQFGFDPRLQVRAPADEASYLISACTGTNSVSEIIAQSKLEGIDCENLATVISRLIETGQLISATTLQESESLLDVEFEVSGAGRLGTTVAILLAQSGAQNIRVLDRSLITNADVTAWGPSRLDVGQRRDHTVLLILERIHRGMWPRLLRPIKPALPKLAILCPDPIGQTPWLAPHLTDEFLAADQPHLIASTGSTSALVSTVLNPNSTACLRCFHARLSELDSAWPLIASQLIGRASRDLASSALILHTASFIVEQAISWAAGLSQESSEKVSGFYELTSPKYQPQFIPLATHWSCGCQWNQAS